jgi:hypothetical protein
VIVALSVYRFLMCFYPRSYRHEFGAEMTYVFCAARRDLPPALFTKISFYLHEFGGLIWGALCAHFDWLLGPNISIRRFSMQSQFRFPRSTVFLMWVILAGVVLAIQKAKIVVQREEGLPSGTVAVWHPFLFWLYSFAVVLAVAGAIWGILFALRRTGMHRLANVETLPEQQ